MSHRTVEALPEDDDMFRMERPILRIAVMVSGNGSNLQSLIDREHEFHYRIMLVVSDNPDAYALTRAREANIPVLVVDRRDYEVREDFETALIRGMGRVEPDLIVLAGFMRILSQRFIYAFEHHIINIHPSLLPKYKGLNTHARALEAGESKHGATVHYVTAELDGGPLISYGDVSVYPDDTPETLAKRVLSVEHRLLPDVVGALAFERINYPPEPILLDGGLKAPFHYSQMFSM